MYCPYIASAMVDAKDTTYYNISGVLIYDPVIGQNDIQDNIPAVSFVDYWTGLFPFNDSFVADIHSRDASCGYTDYLNKYLVYPPVGQQPTVIAGQEANGTTKLDCALLYIDIMYAALTVNPCWDIYQVATTCPLQWDILGCTFFFSFLFFSIWPLRESCTNKAQSLAHSNTPLSEQTFILNAMMSRRPFMLLLT